MRWAWWCGLLLAAACSGDDATTWRRADPAASTSRHFVVGFDDDAAVAQAAGSFGAVTPLLSPQRALALQRRAGARCGWTQPDLRLLRRASVPAGWSDAEARAWADEQAASEGIGFVVFRGDPPPSPGDIEPTTPDHEGDQGYLHSDPGIDAMGAAAMGFSGAGVRLSDVEYGWNAAHEELEDIDLGPEEGQTVAAEALEQGFAPDHGTAAIGMILAAPGGYGITGMAPGVQAQTFPEWTEEGGFRRAEAVAAAVAASEPGDVVMLQMQIQDRDSGGFGPAELDEDIWLLTRMATDAGVIVVAAAGNGGLDLDDLDAYRDRGDSGALLVGAGDSELHNTLPFSGHGARVDLQGWGEDVLTLGYGDFALYGEDANQAYTVTFEGTSAGVPMVAAAAALVTEAARAALGEPLTPLDVRRLLVGTGSAAGEGPHVGPIPNVPAAIDALIATPPGAGPGPLQVEIDPGLDGLVVGVPADDPTAALDVTVALTQSVPVYRVQVDAVEAGGAESLGFDETAPFEIEGLELSAGTWTLTATATDVWGHVEVSPPVSLEVEVDTKDDTGSTTFAGGTDSATPATGAPSGSTGETEPAAGGDGDGGDSGCRVGRRRKQAMWGWAALLLLLLGRRRRVA